MWELGVEVVKLTKIVDVRTRFALAMDKIVNMCGR
jgi:hypothetical protein